MAIEQDILALLFSMTTIRGIFRTYYQGGSRPASAESLAQSIASDFPSIPLLTAREAAIVLHSAFESGQALSGFIAERQAAAGSVWPGGVGVPGDSPFADPISGVNPPEVPDLFFPGVSHGTQIYEVQYGIETTTRLGTTDVVHLTAMVSVPMGSSYGDFLDSLQAEMESQSRKYDAEIDRTESGEPNPAYIDIVWGATL